MRAWDTVAQMAGRQRTSSVVESGISRLWEPLLVRAGHQDPTRTLLPADDAATLDAATLEVAALEPSTAGSGLRPPAASEEARTAIESRSYLEFARRYRLIRHLDEGGMGSVWLAWHHGLAREVAVKILRKDDSPTRRLLFRAEALVTAYLEHPNIVPVYDAADHCLVMRHVHGASLGRMLDERTDMSRVIEILLKVCDAIAFAHSRGIIHRDIKAENVMVGAFGEVVVVDWGLALAVGPDPEGVWRAPRLERCPSVCAGTPGCLPPEVARGDRAQLGTWTDVHMLGGLLYHALSGRLPYELSNSSCALVNAAASDRVPLAEAAPAAPPRLAQLCDQAMAALPAERPTLPEFVSELHAWLVRNDARLVAETGTYRAVHPRPPSGWMMERFLGRR